MRTRAMRVSLTAVLSMATLLTLGLEPMVTLFSEAWMAPPRLSSRLSKVAIPRKTATLTQNGPPFIHSSNTCMYNFFDDFVEDVFGDQKSKEQQEEKEKAEAKAKAEAEEVARKKAAEEAEAAARKKAEAEAKAEREATAAAMVEKAKQEAEAKFAEFEASQKAKAEEEAAAAAAKQAEEEAAKAKEEEVVAAAAAKRAEEEAAAAKAKEEEAVAAAAAKRAEEVAAVRKVAEEDVAIVEAANIDTEAVEVNKDESSQPVEELELIQNSQELIDEAIKQKSRVKAIAYGFNRERGYGFAIPYQTPEEGDKIRKTLSAGRKGMKYKGSVFVHHKCIRTPGNVFNRLSFLESIEMGIVQEENGKIYAEDVSGLGGDYVLYIRRQMKRKEDSVDTKDKPAEELELIQVSQELINEAVEQKIRVKAIVPWYSVRKGYGFAIPYQTPEEGEEIRQLILAERRFTGDVFVHQSNIRTRGDDDFRRLSILEDIEMGIVDIDGLKYARDISGPDGDYVSYTLKQIKKEQRKAAGETRDETRAKAAEEATKEEASNVNSKAVTTIEEKSSQTAEKLEPIQVSQELVDISIKQKSRVKAVVNWFDLGKGYGFVFPYQSEEEGNKIKKILRARRDVKGGIFVHLSQIRSPSDTLLRISPFEQVEITIGLDGNGRVQAEDVSGPDGDYVHYVLKQIKKKEFEEKDQDADKDEEPL